jgi:hypothetical protein
MRSHAIVGNLPEARVLNHACPPLAHLHLALVASTLNFGGEAAFPQLPSTRADSAEGKRPGAATTTAALEISCERRSKATYALRADIRGLPATPALRWAKHRVPCLICFDIRLADDHHNDEPVTRPAAFNPNIYSRHATKKNPSPCCSFREAQAAELGLGTRSDTRPCMASVQESARVRALAGGTFGGVLWGIRKRALMEEYFEPGE